MTITRNFKLCLNAGTQNAPYINVNQYDEGEEWVFDLYTEGGQKFTPSTGSIIGIKADGHAILNSGTVNSNGQVVITETQQMTAASGLAVFELLIEGETHGTSNFIVNVERRPADDAEFSDSDISLLQEAIDSAAEIEELLGGHDVPSVITPIITDWLEDNITNPSNPPIDTSLTVAGAAADAKATGDRIRELESIAPYVYNSVQKSKNKLVVNPSFTGVYRDLEIKWNLQGGLTVNGTPSQNIAIPVTGNNTFASDFPAGTYTFSLKDVTGFSNSASLYVRWAPDSSSPSTMIVYHNTNNRTATVTFTEPVFVYIQFLSGNTYNNASFKLQIEEGSSATDFERPDGIADYVAREYIEANKDANETRRISSLSYNVTYDRYSNIEYINVFSDIASLSGSVAKVKYDYGVNFQHEPFSIRMDTEPTDGYADCNVNVNTPIDPWGIQEVDMFFYIEDASKITSVRMQMLDTGMSKTQQSITNGWNKIRFSTYGGGSIDYSQNNTRFRIRIYTTNNITLWIGAVVVVKPDKANIIIIEDAGYKTFYDIAYPAFKTIGVPITWAIDPYVIDATDNKTGSRPKMGIEDIEYLAYDGISEFSFHNYDGTYMSTATKEEALADTLNCIRWLKEKGLQPQHLFRGAWFQNNCPNHELADLEVEASASYDGSTGFTPFPFIDKYNIPRYAMQGRETSLIDTWFSIMQKQHSTLLLYTHGIGDNEQDTSETLLSYYVQKCQEGITGGWLNCTTYNRLMKHYERIK